MFSYDVVTGNLGSATTGVGNTPFRNSHHKKAHWAAATGSHCRLFLLSVARFYALLWSCKVSLFLCVCFCYVFSWVFPGFYAPWGESGWWCVFGLLGGVPFSCCLLLAPSPSVFSAQTPFVLRPTGTGRSVGRVAAVLLGNAPSSRLASLRYISHRFPTNFKGFSGKIVLLTLVTARVVTCGR